MKYAKLLQIPAIREILIFGYRFKLISCEIGSKVKLSFKWLFTSNETTNFTYDLTDINKKYLAEFVAHITHKSYSQIYNYIQELDTNKLLKQHIYQTTKECGEEYKSAKQIFYARRIIWYAIARATKPKVIVETGIDKGLGSCVLISALMANKKEGFEGYYYGTDINPKAGYLLTDEYTKFGKVLYGDSITSLKKLNKRIDLFINDSIHINDYEYREYLAVEHKLNSNAILLSHSHLLFKFSQKTNRDFLCFTENPKDFWRVGSTISISFK